MSVSCTLKVAAVRDRMATLEHTQASLAAECGVDVRTVQRWFAGQRVGLARAEEVARALRMGTAELFRDVPEDGFAAFAQRIGMFRKRWPGREGVVANSFRIVQEHFATVLQAVSYTGHPVRGFVARRPVDRADGPGFACLRLGCEAEYAQIGVRYQLGKRFSYLAGGIRLTPDDATLAETFQVRSMRARRSSDGSVRLWFWVSAALQEVITIANVDVQLQRSDEGRRLTLELDRDSTCDALCLRPSIVDLRAAGLPMGFDRVTGARGRVDVPLEWDPVSVCHA